MNSIPTAAAESKTRSGGSTQASRQSGWAAWSASFLFHAAFVVALALLTLTPRAQNLLDLSLAPFEEVDFLEPLDESPQEFHSSDDSPEEIGALSAGGSAAALAAASVLNEETTSEKRLDLTDATADLPAIELESEPFRSPVLSQNLVVQGAGSVGATGAEGAIDRLTHEILASLESHPTLVVWLFDESGSLRMEREKILGRFRRIYEELGVIEASRHPAFRRPEDKPLLTAVVGFGAEPRLLTAEPTDRFEEIEAAVKVLQTDDPTSPAQRDAWSSDPQLYRQLSQENVFSAIGMVAEKFRVYRTPSHGRRRVMIVVFTDESGDDRDRADEVVALCRKLVMPVYVVGRPAPFGRETAYVKWIDPDPRFDQRPQWVPVSLGPESMAPELPNLRLPGESGPDPLVDSGFGPYALTRLCFETGGLYFAVHPNRTEGREVTAGEIDELSAHFSMFFSEESMRRYRPDYLSASEYGQLVNSNHARLSLVEASRLSWNESIGGFRLRFPRRDDAQLARDLSEAQRTAALVQPRIDALYRILQSGMADREVLDEPRWQAGFDLALGRCLAAKVRADGYNLMLASIKQGRSFERSRSNAWVLRPATTFESSSLERMAKRSKQLLEQVVADHPGTPWAYFAQRDLAEPLGWKWTEGYVYLPPLEERNVPPSPPPQTPPPGPVRRDPPPL
jgi:hypothetical protein